MQQEWADRYKGQFDDGWDVYREKTLERQKKLGIVPRDTELTERPDLFPAWDSLSDAERKRYARQLEVFAGFSENADWNVGRLLDDIEARGELDNTLILYIWGDNGASMEGTLTGSFNETTFLNGVVLDAEHQLALIEEDGGMPGLGGEASAPHFASAWAHANNTPFQWGKQMASHLGGARNPMVVACPSRISPDTAVRDQFTHVIDIGPTVLQGVGIPEPKSIDGIEQEPMDGTSFLYSFDDAKAADQHTVQYFEMFVNGEEVGKDRMPRTVPVAFSTYAGMDVARDHGLVVDREYEEKAPYAFTGTVKGVVFDLQPNHHDDELAIHQSSAQGNLAHGAAG